MAAVLAEITWLQTLLSEVHIQCLVPPLIFCDSQNAIMLAANPILHNRSKHFEIDLYFVRDKIAQKQAFV